MIYESFGTQLAILPAFVVMNFPYGLAFRRDYAMVLMACEQQVKE
jgi:hypothetical protein